MMIRLVVVSLVMSFASSAYAQQLGSVEKKVYSAWAEELAYSESKKKVDFQADKVSDLIIGAVQQARNPQELVTKLSESELIGPYKTAQGYLGLAKQLLVAYKTYRTPLFNRALNPKVLRTLLLVAEETLVSGRYQFSKNIPSGLEFDFSKGEFTQFNPSDAQVASSPGDLVLFSEGNSLSLAERVTRGSLGTFERVRLTNAAQALKLSKLARASVFRFDFAETPEEEKREMGTKLVKATSGIRYENFHALLPTNINEYFKTSGWGTESLRLPYPPVEGVRTVPSHLFLDSALAWKPTLTLPEAQSIEMNGSYEVVRFYFNMDQIIFERGEFILVSELLEAANGQADLVAGFAKATGTKGRQSVSGDGLKNLATFIQGNRLLREIPKDELLVALQRIAQPSTFKSSVLALFLEEVYLPEGFKLMGQSAPRGASQIKAYLSFYSPRTEVVLRGNATTQFKAFVGDFGPAIEKFEVEANVDPNRFKFLPAEEQKEDKVLGEAADGICDKLDEGILELFKNPDVQLSKEDFFTEFWAIRDEVKAQVTKLDILDKAQLKAIDGLFDRVSKHAEDLQFNPSYENHTSKDLARDLKAFVNGERGTIGAARGTIGAARGTIGMARGTIGIFLGPIGEDESLVDRYGQKAVQLILPADRGTIGRK